MNDSVNELIILIYPYIRIIIYIYTTILILSLLSHIKYYKITKELHLPKEIQSEISETACLFQCDFLFIVFIGMCFPILNILCVITILCMCRDDLSKKKILKRYEKYIDEKLSKFRICHDKDLDLIKTNMLKTNNENYKELFKKFIQIVGILKEEPYADVSTEVNELKIIILKDPIVCKQHFQETNSDEKNNSKSLKKDTDYKLNKKEITKYINNLEYNKNNILKYLDNRTEGEYKNLLELVLSKDNNPYYTLIIENAYTLSNIINDFENNNYILNHERNENTKNKIRKSIFEFIEVVNLIDELNYKQDETIKNIEDYNNYLEIIKSDINKKIAIFGTPEHYL